MSITIKTRNPLVRFSELKTGDLFRYKEMTYMKVTEIDISKDVYDGKTYMLNAITMGGVVTRVLEGATVESLKAELHIL